MASSSSSSFPEPHEEVENSINNMMTLRLDSSNYFYWARRITLNLRANGIRGYVDGSIKPPPESTPAFHLWRRYDSRVMSAIHATLSSSALPHVLGAASARDLWLRLERRFTAMSGFNVAKFRADLETVVKGEEESVSVYVGRVGGLRTKLAGFAVLLDDAEMVGHALRGLPEEYEAFRNSIAARDEPLRWNEFHVLLLAEEASILARNQH